MARHTWWEVAPRYTPGSPSMVSRTTALYVAEQEKRAYNQALTGCYGEEMKQTAETQELRGIVWSWHQVRNEILWHDEITHEQGRIKLRKSEMISWPWKREGK